MLKTLFKEVRRSLSRSAASDRTDQQSSDESALQVQQETFARSDRIGRDDLAGALSNKLEAQAGDAGEWALLGDWQLQLGRLTEAEAAYRQALQLQPQHARAQEGLGIALMQLGQLDEAYLRLESASKLDPMNSEIWTHWGLVDLHLGNLARASEKFQRAIERNPRDAHAWHNLGLVTYKQGNAQASVELFQHTVTLRPDFGLAYSNLALALRRAEKVDEAIAAAQRATELKQDNARVWVVLADVLITGARHEDAKQSISRAQAIDPGDVGSWVALGKLQAATGHHEAAEAAYGSALRRHPGHADAEAGLSELLLSQRRWTPAWELHEARRRVEPTPVRNFPLVEWQGQALSGHRVLLHAEQGMGDIIMFASCIGDIQRFGAQCVIEVPPRLQSLFERSFPDCTVIGHSAQDSDISWINDLPLIDMHLPMGSLPRWFRRGERDFPERSAYLTPDAAKVEAWRTRLADDGRRPIGIAWRGGLAITSRQQRTLRLAELARALPTNEIQLVCLQYGDVTAELQAVSEELGIKIHPGLSGYGDFDELAALTAACDAVLTVCSSQAHLTGALGKPGLVLVPRHPNWRYGAEGPSMPWYPSLTMARQSTANDWTPVLREAAGWVQQVKRPGA